MRASSILILIATAAAPLAAQETNPKARTTTTTATTTKPTADTARSLQIVWASAKEAGVTERTYWGLVDSLRRRSVPTDATTQILQTEVEAVRAAGSPRNFGAVVHTYLGKGLRGRDLSAAIRAEHQRRGMGRGHSEARAESQGRPESRGRPVTAPDTGKGSGRKP